MSDTFWSSSPHHTRKAGRACGCSACGVCTSTTIGEAIEYDRPSCLHAQNTSDLVLDSAEQRDYKGRVLAFITSRCILNLDFLPEPTMSSSSQKALYADERGNFIVRDDIANHSPAANEVLVKVHFSGVNPADVRHTTALGIRSTVVGYDFSGAIVQAPSGSDIKEGDIIAGYTPSSLGRPSKYGAHQDVISVPSDMAFRVPSNLPESHASALTVVAMTAADAMYNLFKAPLPTEPGAIEKPILIWGGSSSVGLCAIQFARASGFRSIFVTASSSRHEMLRGLGATHLFDYNSPTVTKDISEAIAVLGKGPIAYAFDAAGTQGGADSSEALLQCVDDSASLVSVLLRKNHRFQFPVAVTNTDFRIHPPGAPHPISIPARPDDHWRAWKAVKWAIANYGSGFRLPSVNVLDVTAEEAIDVLLNVENGKRGHGKVVFKHPFK
jgi:NADPH:quinone reductase-like Zn-dependent oxidoreductase